MVIGKINMKNNFKQTCGFVLTSLSSTGLELILYSILNTIIDNYLPFFHIVISSIASRGISELVKFELDKNAVFKSKDSSLINYIILAITKGLISTACISIIYYITQGNRTSIKICVDFCLFFPSFLISKIWVHNQK